MDFLKWIVKPKSLVGGIIVTVISSVVAGAGKAMIMDSIEKPKVDPESNDGASNDLEALPNGEDFTEVEDEKK